MKLLDGAGLSRRIRTEIAREVDSLVAQGHRRPCLAAVLVGNNGGSESYVANKVKACTDCGVESRICRFDSAVTEDVLLQAIEELNHDADVDGFIVQLPLPRHIDQQRIINAIDPTKDVDGFTPANFGSLAIGLPAFVPATPAGILDLLEEYDIETKGKHCVILGRSNIVGKPMALLMMRKAQPGDCTVTVCNSATVGLESYSKTADILICAMGRPGSVTQDMVRPGAVVVDVGTTRVPDPSTDRGWRLRGDVDFEKVAPMCSYITPVPGGVGPMTVVSLIKNTLEAYKRHVV